MIPGKLPCSGPPLPPGCILEPGLDTLRALPPLALVLCDTGQALLEKPLPGGAWDLFLPGLGRAAGAEMKDISPELGPYGWADLLVVSGLSKPSFVWTDLQPFGLELFW